MLIIAQLTWRDIAAPDFSSGIQGLRTATDMFSNAIAGAQDIVTGIERGREDALTKRIMAEAMRTRDPEALDAMIASGSIAGRDLANAPVRTLEALEARRTNLGNQEWQEYQRNNQREQTDAQKAVAPIIANAFAGAAGGDRSALANAFADPANREQLAKAGISTMTEFMDTVQSYNRGELTVS